MTNQVTRWTPSQQLAVAREPFFRLFDTFFNDGGEDLTTRSWTPPVDIQETDDAYHLHAELPGLTKDDKKENYHRIERTYGTFSRSFALPTQVSSDKVEAKFDNGVLSVVVPKAEQAKPRRINIA